jgi:hypothetical protein
VEAVMRRWQLTIGLAVAAVGAAAVAPRLGWVQPEPEPEPQPELIPEVTDPRPWVLSYRDADGDWFGNPARTHRGHEVPPGYVLGGGDCDDRDERRFPGAFDLPGDHVDQDCDGVDPRRPAPTIPEVDERPAPRIVLPPDPEPSPSYDCGLG